MFVIHIPVIHVKHPHFNNFVQFCSKNSKKFEKNSFDLTLMLTYSMDEKGYIRGFKVFTRNNQVQSVVTLDVPIPISTIKIASINIYFRILQPSLC